MSQSPSQQANVQKNETKDLGILELDDFKMWSSIALKSFLSLRKKSVIGSTEVLVARAFSCYEENVPVDHKQEHTQRVLLKEYKDKLIIDGEAVPDPMDLSKLWIGEDKGMIYWPRLYFTDISRFYSDVIGKRNLIERLESEYKQGKAYRYFSNSFIGEVMYNNINDSSLFCLFKTKCMPSQRVNMKQYDVWIIVRKDKGNIIGGEVKNAYCTCTAGLLGSCNHVAGLLFRIESAVITGVSNPTCTSLKASWNVPSKKKLIEPGLVSNFVFTQDSYLKKSVQKSTEKRKSAGQFKIKFQVMSDSQKKVLNNGDIVRSELFNEIQNIIPNSCFVELTEQKKKQHIPSVALDIPSLKEFANLFKTNLDQDEIFFINDMFADSIYLTDNEIRAIYNATKDQANSTEWFKYRQGRLTASKFKSIVNCAKRLRNNTNEKCPKYIVSFIMGYDTVNPTWQMKHGINNEFHAKAKFKQIFRKSHKNCKFNDPGMTVMKSHPFISVTPDMEIECLCHGSGLVEIKCPASIIGKVPHPENYAHIEEANGIISLKKNSEYYFQIQGQLGVTQKKYCYFFIFSFHGNLTVRVPFDEEFWSYMIDNLNWFWRSQIAPELLDNEVEKNIKLINEEDIIIVKRNVTTYIDLSLENISSFTNFSQPLNENNIDFEIILQ
ncbi:uncharacterized protein LOC124810062 [Hydra vulgaris]|uniref:uncharacterized protein LOC124810062 n=1 Tax=Hydra vulgaris TaxID=6087 RepID=UPI0032E9DCAE